MSELVDGVTEPTQTVLTPSGDTSQKEEQMTQITTHLGVDVDKSLNDLLVTTESLGYQRGTYDTIKRMMTVLEETADLLDAEGLKHNAAGIRVAMKMIGGIYVAKPHTK
jgi:hypothetical protein